ncbi:unnamed protein product [Urochloa humidicola]
MAATVLLLLMAMAIHARCFESDTISADSAVSGGRTIVSRGGRFELGFFSPAGSSGHSYYVGIWYKKAVSQRTPVWVANRAAPVSDPASSRLAVAADGNLVLTNEAGKLVWSSNISSYSGDAVAAVIMDTGNLVLRRGDNGEVLWQSVEHPTDTWLPGVRLGMNKLTGDVQTLVSWKSSGDPAPGLFSLAIDPNGSSQYFLTWNGTERYWSSGLWNGEIFAGVPEMTSHARYDFEFESGANGSYFCYSLQDPTVISRLVLDVSGQTRMIMWLPSAGEWMIIWKEPDQLCHVHAVCGAFGVCRENERNEPFCSCPAGFRPTSEGDWELGDHSRGCRRNNPLQCDGDAFLLASGMSLRPSPAQQASSSAQDCRLACQRSCNCTAYSYGTSHCSLWYGDLLDLQRVDVDDTAGVDDLYLRLSAKDVPSKSHKRTVIFASIASVSFILALVVTVSVAVIRAFRTRQRSVAFMQAASEGGNLVAFKYSDMRGATRNFSEKLGGGGFGSVYKGTLPGSRGAAIAVKKLEGRVSGVGEKQFRNEVRTIGVIQHVNLVRLRGFVCSRAGDRLLVYDHMPNGSLDKVLFGEAEAEAPALSWAARFRIAVGAARGLLYLHEGCRDCIIHCDIKPENILLDAGLVPKVADFGMAKLVGRDFSRVLTTVRGTVGYLAPEWIAGVPITAKADVYSYGMVLLELVSGRRNARRRWENTELLEGPSFSGYFPLVAARVVNGGEEELAGLLDERLRGDADAAELERVCRVACWCVQDDEACRPTMEQVVQALEGVVALDVLPVPRSLQALVEGSDCFDGISEYHHLGVQNSC